MSTQMNDDVNIIANSDLEITYFEGDVNVIQKLDDEPNDVGGLTSAELKAKFDEGANIIKKFINESLIPELLAADATEATRAAAEAERVSNEEGRVKAEQARVEAETTRQTNEGTRDTKEAQRAAAEQERANAEAARKTAEEGRATAENLRVNSENARSTAEQSRATAESGRATAETARIKNEEARALAEQNRATAETQRVAAEKSRADAETARSVWEEYSNTKTYVPGNKVSYQGSSYQNKKTCTGVLPPDDASCWFVIAAAGADGDGTGDMVADTYDPQGKRTDIFAYVEQHGGEQSDWNENDPESKAHVKNRFGGYMTEGKVEVCAETTVTVSKDGGVTDSVWSPPGIGIQYVVVFDDSEYSCISYASANGPTLGSLDTEPFKILEDAMSGGSYIYCATAGTHTYSVYEVRETPVPIDEKFLPDTVAKIEDVINQIGTHNTDTTAHSEIREALAVLSRFQNGLGNEYVWAKQTSKVYPVFNRTEYGGDCVITGGTSGTVTFYNSYEIENGSVVLKDIWQTFSVTSSNVGTVLSASVLNAGVKYLYRLDGTVVRTIPGETSGYYSDGLLQNVLMPTETFTGEFTVSYDIVGYVNSPDSNAYPIDDGYTYTALGQMGNKARIATGSYTGTGTYGSSNPNSLTFDFAPKVLILLIADYTEGYQNMTSIVVATKDRPTVRINSTYSVSGSSANHWFPNAFVFSDKKVTWYINESLSDGATVYDGQFNRSGTTYYYIAIG